MQNTQPNTINFLNNLIIINQTDTRQQVKIKYKLNELVAIALIATIGNANDFAEMECFAKEHKQTLQKFIPIKQIPNHDTIYRTFDMIEKNILRTCKKILTSS